MTSTDLVERVALKPCPFCGGNDLFVERADFSSCHVVCNDCGARGPDWCNENDDDVAAEDAGMEPGENAARRHWNARAAITALSSPDGLGDELEALRQTLIRWIEEGPNSQPAFKSGLRAFSTGDLKAFVAALTALRTSQADQRGKVGVRYELEWLAAARPPLHPVASVGRQSFLSEQAARDFFSRKPSDTQLIALDKIVTVRTPIERTDPSPDHTDPSRDAGEETYAAWQQKRGILADTVDWAILEYDEFMLDDAYDSQRVLNRIIARLREVRDTLATPPEPSPTESRDAGECERHMQARWLAGNIVNAGHIRPCQSKWDGLYGLAMEFVRMTQLQRCPAILATPPEPSVHTDTPMDGDSRLLVEIADMMSEFVDNWPKPKKVKTALALIAKTMRAALDPPKHKYWGAGEPDCPRDIKAGNGEVHTLRCKVCGEDSPSDDRCLPLSAPLPPAPTGGE